ncbi:MAG TPA: YeeE/YedE thiosulfate transporter family protein, partial [Anaeromyxobacteraceae bacterium]|nr:YeeE/YedE thiosulfate transporter family protein [Anaeromyxobacteraceae bacterium]
MTFPVLPPFHVGLVVAIASGFCFGFVLERAGFGRAQKLVGQFYGYDLSVFKVMFTAVVTAMTVVLLASAAGLTEFKVIADHAASATWLVPFVAGGIVVGMGFVMSGYCPGTSWVAMGSGKVDGLFTVVGSMLGGLVWSELEGRPGFAAFHNATYLGSFYLWELFHLPARAGPAIVGAAVVAMAVACFALAERVERALAGRADPLARGTPGGRPRRFVISGLAAGAAAALALLLVPVGTQAVPSPAQLSAADLARRVLEEPWSVRVVDLRRREACAARRVPGAECVPEPELGKLGLADASPARDLVLVADGSLAATPPAAGAFPGRVLALSGGWKAWEEYALAPPSPPAADADPAARDAFRLRAGLQSALTGMKAAPPPPPPSAAPA